VIFATCSLTIIKIFEEINIFLTHAFYVKNYDRFSYTNYVF